MKKRFNLACMVTVSAHTEVLAATREEAIEIARSREVVLGGVGSGAYEDESWVIEEADGVPTDITVQEEK